MFDFKELFELINEFRVISKINRGNRNHLGGDFERALKHYDKALKIKPDCKYALTFKGMTYGLLGKFDPALKCYDESIRSDPHYIDAWRHKINLISDSFDIIMQ